MIDNDVKKKKKMTNRSNIYSIVKSDLLVARRDKLKDDRRPNKRFP